MNKLSTSFIILVCGLLMGFASKNDLQKNDVSQSTIFASIDENNVIILRLVSKSNDRIAHGYFRYPIGDKKYQALKKEIGSLRVGEWKEIQPFDKDERSAIEVHLTSQ